MDIEDFIAQLAEEEAMRSSSSDSADLTFLTSEGREAAEKEESLWEEFIDLNIDAAKDKNKNWLYFCSICGKKSKGGNMKDEIEMHIMDKHEEQFLQWQGVKPKKEKRKRRKNRRKNRHRHWSDSMLKCTS